MATQPTKTPHPDSENGTPDLSWVPIMVLKTQDILYRVLLTPEPKLEFQTHWQPYLSTFFDRDEPVSIADLNDLLHPDDLPVFKARLTCTNLKVPMQVRWKRNDGVYEWYEHVDTPILNDQQQIIGIQGIARYYTDHHEAEVALAQAEERFEKIFHLCPVAISISDIETGEYLDVNERLLELVGFSREEMIGKRAQDLGIWEDIANREAVVRALQSGEIIHMLPIRLKRQDGAVLEGLVSAEKIDLNGRDGLLAITQDITQLQQAVQNYTSSQERLKEIIEFLPDATFVIDQNGKVIAWNHAIENMSGVPAKEMIGKGDYAYAVPFYGERRPLMADILLNPDLNDRYLYDNIQRDGNDVQADVHLPNFHDTDSYLWLKASPLYDDQHQITGAIESIRDISELKHSQLALQEHLHELEVLNRVIAAANSSLNPDDMLHAICVEVTQMLNVPQAGIALLNDDKTGLIVMATEDMNNSAPATGYTILLENNEASQRAIREGKPVVVAHAQTDPANESVHDIMQQRRTISMLIAPILIHGQVIGTLGLDMDVFHEFTQHEIDLAQSCAQVIGQALENMRLYQKVKQELAERRMMADALRESEERYRTLVENQGEGVAILDLELRFTFTNPAAEGIFGVPPGGLIGKPLTDFIHPEQKERLMDEIADSATGGKFIFEADIQTAGGSERNLILTANVRRGTDDAVSGIFAVFRDNTERKQAEIKLRFLSTHDTLTELFNRTYFEEEMVRLAMSRMFPISIIVVDVDGLKHVNDNYGHPRGDELLRRTAGVLRASFRLEDLVARIGGDEFGILLPNADAAAAARGIERVRKFLLSHNTTNQGLQISLSLGAATAEAHESLTETYKRADQAMYMDKASRRGRTIVDAFH